MFVAPLEVIKDKSSALGLYSFSFPATPVGHPRLVAANLRGEMTPPLTPHDQDNSNFKGWDCGSEFHNYLRAIYPFHSTCDEDSLTVTLSLSTDDIILVHSIHTNGWADGTLLSSGARGWLPTNYCEPYHGEHIRALMRSLTNFWDMVRGRTREESKVFNSQDYVQGLVSGVRHLLVINKLITTHILELIIVQVKTNCLNRMSSLIQSHSGLRRTRKALLADLSTVVRIARGFEVITSQGLEVPVFKPDLDELIIKAFKMVIRAIRFLDIWEADIATHGSEKAIDKLHTTSNVPPTPPAERTDFGAAEIRRMHETPELGSAATCHNSLDEARGRTDRTSVRPHYSHFSRTSQTHKCPGSIDLCTENRRSVSVQSQRQSISHRVSWSTRPKGSAELNLASEKLYALHDAFLSFLGYFIGLHLQSHSSVQLLHATQKSVETCRGMLKVVEAIWKRDSMRSKQLEEAKDEMYYRIFDLVGVARHILRPPKAGDEDGILMSNEGKPLVDAATACVRGAGRCVAESRFVIERIGDFELETLGLGITGLDNTDSPQSPTKPSNRIAKENQSDLKESSIAPRPLSKPPPLPIDIQDHTPIASAISSPSIRSTWPSKSMYSFSPGAPNRSSFHSLLPPLGSLSEPLISDNDCLLTTLPLLITNENKQDQTPVTRLNTFDLLNSRESSTLVETLRDSKSTTISQTSTRATSPETTPTHVFGISMSTSISGSQITLAVVPYLLLLSD